MTVLKYASFIAACFGLSVASQPAASFSYHDNVVNLPIADHYSVKDGSFTVESFKISSGQDPDGKIYQGLKVGMSGAKNELTFTIGRHKTDEVAKWFTKRVPAGNNTFNKDPGKLNFALMGTLVLDLKASGWVPAQGPFTFKDIMFAQGSSGAANNWWFGGKHCTNSYTDDKHSVLCFGEDANGRVISFEFKRGGEGSITDVNTVQVTPVSFMDTRNWLGELPDTTKLSDIVMPGSHDAGMSKTEHCTIPGSSPLVKTQALNIGDQANAGSRYFDIRVDYDHDELVTYHRSDGGIGCNGQTIDEIFKQAIAFLGEWEDEFLIFKFSHIRADRNDQDKIMQKLNDLILKSKNQNAMYKNASGSVLIPNLTLGDVRGKIIAVFDYADYVDTTEGKFRYHNGSSNSSNLTVYDDYANTPNLSDMIADQQKKLNEYGGLGQEHLFLLSWTLTGGPIPININAAAAYQALPDFLYDQIVTKGGNRPNIVYLDFIEPNAMQVVLQYNFLHAQP